MLYKSLKDTLKYTPTCFGSHKINHRGVITCTWLKLHTVVQLCLLCAWSVFGSMPPNTDHAHNKHIWTVTRTCNFSQVQIITPWWWTLCDPKLVGVYFNIDFNVYDRNNIVH